MKNSILRLVCGSLLALSFTGAFAQQQERGQQRQQQQQQQQQNRLDQMAGAAIQSAAQAAAALSDPLQLIFRKDVQHDLLLDLGQRNKFDNMHERHQTELRQEMQQRRQNRRNNAPPSDLPEKQRKETQAKMDELLTKEQKARLSQIALQLQGPAVLLTADMQKQLGVTQEQNLRIAQIQADRDVRLKELQAGIAARQIRPQDIQSQMDQIQKDTSAMITEMLTEEQSAQLQKIFGRPFKVGG